MQSFIGAVRRALASLAGVGRSAEGQAAGGEESKGSDKRSGNAATESIELSETDKTENPHKSSGLRKYRLGEFEEAVVEFDKALESEPENAGVYVMRGGL